MKYPNERRIQTSILLTTYNEMVSQNCMTPDDYIAALKEAIRKLKAQNEALQSELAKQSQEVQ